MSDANSNPARLKKLRERAGLSMEKLAKALGYKNSSSYQRYEDATKYTREHLPLPLVRALIDVLTGKGDPPISREEVLMLAGLTELNEITSKTIDELHAAPIIGFVATGVYQKDFGQVDTGKQLIAVDNSGDESGVPKYAAKVRDNSFAEFDLKEGATVFFYKIDDVGGSRVISSGELVIVLRHEGNLAEAIVMEFVRNDANRIALYFADSALDPIASEPGGNLPDDVSLYALVYHYNPPTLRQRQPRKH